MDLHVGSMVRSCFYQLIRTIRQSLSDNATRTLIHSFIVIRVDYCNSLLSGVADRSSSANPQRCSTSSSSNAEIPSNFESDSRQSSLVASSTMGEIHDTAARCELHQPQGTFIFARTLCSCLYSAWTLILAIGWTILPSSSTLSVYSDAMTGIFCCGTKCLEWTACFDTHRNMFEQ